METLSLDSLPLVRILPLFMLALLIYGIAEFSFMHFRLRKAKLGEYGMSLKGLGFTMLIGILIDLLIGPFSKLLLALRVQA